MSPYKDTGVYSAWPNLIATAVTSLGTPTPLSGDLVSSGMKSVVLAFAVGECGAETWSGVDGATLATANVALLNQAGITYRVSTGGANGAFTCGTQAGFNTFVSRWAGTGLLGIDFDIEAGQTTAQIQALVQRVVEARTTYPTLLFTFTVATLAPSPSGVSKATVWPSGQTPNPLGSVGISVLQAISAQLGFTQGSAASWPARVRVNPMVMDYGSPSQWVCVVAAGVCDMAQSALQAAIDLRDYYTLPIAAVELTVMIGPCTHTHVHTHPRAHTSASLTCLAALLLHAHSCCFVCAAAGVHPLVCIRVCACSGERRGR